MWGPWQGDRGPGQESRGWQQSWPLVRGPGTVPAKPFPSCILRELAVPVSSPVRRGSSTPASSRGSEGCERAPAEAFAGGAWLAEPRAPALMSADCPCWPVPAWPGLFSDVAMVFVVSGLWFLWLLGVLHAFRFTFTFIKRQRGAITQALQLDYLLKMKNFKKNFMVYAKRLASPMVR